MIRHGVASLFLLLAMAYEGVRTRHKPLIYPGFANFLLV